MSKESYKNGFRKAAEANGVDPKALASYALEKMSADTAGGAAAGGDAAGGGFMDSVRNGIGSFANWWKNPKADADTELYKALIGAATGGALGTGIAGAMGGKKWLRGGSILGALVGAGGAVNWGNVSKAIDSISAEKKNATKGQKTQA